MGTLPYCSPEILKDEPYNQKTDIWALGCILYEMCARKRAFDSESEEGLKQKILSF
jgi:serine/threonine protein kinase